MSGQGEKTSLRLIRPMHYLGLLHLVTMLQTNATHPFSSLSLCICFPPPPQISSLLAAGRSFLCVVSCRPVLIGPGKAGNYSSLVRDGSGLSLAFQRQEFSDTLIFNCSLFKTSVFQGVFKPALHLLLYQ